MVAYSELVFLFPGVGAISLRGAIAQIAPALGRAVRLRPAYTTAHRDLGRALLTAGRTEEAARVLEGGLRVAEPTRDLQAGREIAVLLPRAEPGMSEPRSFPLSAVVHEYLLRHGTPPDAVLRELADGTARLGPISPIQVATEQGAFLTLLARAIGARRATEVGTLPGYSALAAASTASAIDSAM